MWFPVNYVDDNIATNLLPPPSARTRRRPNLDAQRKPCLRPASSAYRTEYYPIETAPAATFWPCIFHMLNLEYFKPLSLWQNHQNTSKLALLIANACLIGAGFKKHLLHFCGNSYMNHIWFLFSEITTYFCFCYCI